MPLRCSRCAKTVAAFAAGVGAVVPEPCEGLDRRHDGGDVRAGPARSPTGVGEVVVIHVDDDRRAGGQHLGSRVRQLPEVLGRQEGVAAALEDDVGRGGPGPHPGGEAGLRPEGSEGGHCGDDLHVRRREHQAPAVPVADDLAGGRVDGEQRHVRAETGIVEALGDESVHGGVHRCGRGRSRQRGRERQHQAGGSEQAETSEAGESIALGLMLMGSMVRQADPMPVPGVVRGVSHNGRNVPSREGSLCADPCSPSLPPSCS